MSKKHKHYDLIVAWAGGAKIQVQSISDRGVNWYDCNPPCWAKNSTYRIKPEPKPDVILYGMLRCVPSLDKYYLTLNDGGTVLWNSDNVKVIADGETYKIKSVEVIK